MHFCASPHTLVHISQQCVVICIRMWAYLADTFGSDAQKSESPKPKPKAVDLRLVVPSGCSALLEAPDEALKHFEDQNLDAKRLNPKL